nr:adenylate/guanylate cyclase domain-containing response regulator [Ardenticatenales bacterium]
FHGLEKIKTIGDSYMLVGGLPTPRADHAEVVAQMALDMREVLANGMTVLDEPIRVRIGLHTGAVVAGVIGTKKFIYDLWGDTVNTASRMEAMGFANSIQVTSATYDRVRHLYEFEERGLMQVKGKGEMPIYLLVGKK